MTKIKKRFLELSIATEYDFVFRNRAEQIKFDRLALTARLDDRNMSCRQSMFQEMSHYGPAPATVTLLFIFQSYA